MNSLLKEKRNLCLLLGVLAIVLLGAVFFGKVQSVIAAVLQGPAVEVCVGNCHRESTVYCPDGYAETGFGGWNDGDQNLTGATSWCRKVGATGLEGDAVKVCSGDCGLDSSVQCPDGSAVTVWGAAATLDEFNRVSAFCTHVGANGLEGAAVEVCGGGCHRESTVYCPDGYVVTGWGGAINSGGDLDRASSFCTKIPSTGTIVANATKDGVAWDAPPFAEVYDAPYGTNQTATIDPPVTFTGMPTGTYTHKSVTPPAGVTFQNVNGSALPYSATLTTGGTITATYNFITIPPSTGTIVESSTKDGVSWDSPPFTATYSGPDGVPHTISLDLALPNTVFSNMAAGRYTTSALTPPPGTTLQSISVSGSSGPVSGCNASSLFPCSATLGTGGTLTVIYNFVTVAAPSPTLVVSPSSASAQVGGTKQFDAIYDPDGSGPLSPSVVTSSSGWTSSNTSVATVSSTGVATGATAGSATITASYSGLTASASFTVTAPVPTLVVSPSSASVPVGGTQQFTAVYDPDGAGPNPSQDVTTSSVWAPTDATRVTVSGSGLATRVGNGYTTIIASYAGLTAYAYVTDPATLRISPSSATLNFGATVQLSASYDPDGASGPQPAQDVTTSASWLSSMPGIASVDNASSKGLVTANTTTAGFAPIFAAYVGLSASSWIIVTATPVPPPPPPPPLVVSCSASPASATTGQPVTWTATATGGTGSYSYSWSGSSPLGGKTGNPVTVTYTTTGTKTGSVTVYSGAQSKSQLCSSSVSVTPSPPPSPPPTATLSASPGIIDKGRSSTLTWSSTNATSCAAMGGFDTGGATSGSASVSPSATSNYQVTCTGPGGSANSNIVTVTVVSVTVSISARPTCISGGGSIKLFWSAAPASQIASCLVSKILPLPEVPLSTQLTSPGTGLSVTIPNTKSTYGISCTTTGGATVAKSVVVDVRSCWTEF